jgi:hypothetical protein
VSRSRTDTVDVPWLREPGADKRLTAGCPAPAPLRIPLDPDAGPARSRAVTVRLQPIRLEAAS